jgi:putative spermidine/putrescine transport system permease protein
VRTRSSPPLYILFGGVLVFMAAPLVIVVVNSFNKSPYSQWPPEGFSTEWYKRVFEHTPFYEGLYNSLKVAGAATVISLVLGATAAYALTRYRIRGRALIEAAYFGPLTVPRVAIGFSLFALYISWHTNLYGTLRGLVVAHVLLALPFAVAIFVSTIGSIDPVYEEAARDLGAGRVKTFVKVTLPQMQTGLIVAALFAFITSFDELEMSIFLVRPETNTLPVTMFFYLEQEQTPALAALSTLLIGVTLVLVLLGLPLLVRGGWQRYLAARA